MATLFAGKTKSGAKIHVCWSNAASNCNSAGHARPPYYSKVTGKVREADLCKKCFNGIIEGVEDLGIEVV